MPKWSYCYRASLLCAGFMLSGSVWAARPMITDDARIVDPGSCQVESWQKSTDQGQEFWLIPACNVGGKVELALGGAYLSPKGQSNSYDLVVQAKTLFRTLKTNDWGVGMAVGAVQHLQYGDTNDWYTYVPISYSFNDQAFVHTNLGVAKKQDHHHSMTWGLGGELKLTSHLWLMGEVFGEGQQQRFVQSGLRLWLLPNRLQLDATVGNGINNQIDEPWFSFGLRWLSPQFY